MTLYDAKPQVRRPQTNMGSRPTRPPGGFAQSEVDFILGIGGIAVKSGTKLGVDTDLATLRRDHDAVFPGPRARRLQRASRHAGARPHRGTPWAYIEMLRQAKDKAEVPVGRRVVVIGGGMTAIDAAVQSRRLGAEQVTIAYRRGPDHMKASRWEQELAQTNGVAIRHWTSPLGFEGQDGHVTGVRFEHRGPGGMGVPRGGLDPGRPRADRHRSDFPRRAAWGGKPWRLTAGRLRVDAERRTTLPDVWAGGRLHRGAGRTSRSAPSRTASRPAHSIDRFVRGLAAPALAGAA